MKTLRHVPGDDVVGHCGHAAERAKSELIKLEQKRSAEVRKKRVAAEREHLPKDAWLPARHDPKRRHQDPIYSKIHQDRDHWLSGSDDCQSLNAIAACDRGNAASCR